MGSGQTLNLTLRHLDKFAWIGGMSGPPRQGFDVATAYDGAFRDAAAFNEKVKLLWLGAGTAEERFTPAPSPCTRRSTEPASRMSSSPHPARTTNGKRGGAVCTTLPRLFLE